MTNFCKILALPVVFSCLIGAGCEKKTVALRPPPQPQPTVETARREVTTPAPTPPRRETATPERETAKSNYPDKATRDRIDTLLGRISDAYFDYNQHSLRPDAISTLQSDSVELRDILKQYPNYKLVIQGYADERGSQEYNLGLGEARAQSAKEYLVQVGIPSQQLSTVSYGKEKPICEDHTEACWQKNRRIHIVAADKVG
jgi:peptidoglycan-associated lipoprotein